MKRTLRLVEERLAETPCYTARPFDDVVFPEKKAPEVLTAKWLANTYQPSPRQGHRSSPSGRRSKKVLDR